MFQLALLNSSLSSSSLTIFSITFLLRSRVEENAIKCSTKTKPANEPATFTTEMVEIRGTCHSTSPFLEATFIWISSYKTHLCVAHWRNFAVIINLQGELTHQTFISSVGICKLLFLAHMKVYKAWWKVFIMVINLMHLANVERLCAAKIEKVTFNRLLTIKLWE